MGLKDKLEIMLLRWQKCVVVVSDGLRTEVAERTKLDQYSIRVAPNFIADIPECKNRPNRVYTSKLCLVAIGRLAPEKGFDLAIRALCMTRDIHCFLDIIGEGPQRAYLESLISEAGLEDRIEMLGEVPGAARLLPKYDVIVVPSRSESFGIVVLEAYRAGVSVIATSVRGLSDVVAPDSAIVVEPESPRALAEAIRMLASDPKLRTNLADAGRRRFEEVFELNRSVRILLSIYKNVLDNAAVSSQ
jgi:glycosyltransferase involved in cell wall biosynthesis